MKPRFRIMRLLTAANVPLSGAEISMVTCVESAVLYPILAGLETDGLIEGGWEGETDHRRRVYRVIAEGPSPEQEINHLAGQVATLLAENEALRDCAAAKVSAVGYDELTDELMGATHGLLRIIGGREPGEAVDRAVRAHALLLRLHSLAFPVDGAQQWRDISTAPKDRRDVLLYWPLEGCSEYMDRRKIGYWNGDSWVWQDRAVRSYSAEPTHWMPLPAPPAALNTTVAADAKA